MIAANTELGFENDAFDFVFSSHCLEHSTDLTATFSEIRRVLKPGGKIFYSVPFGFDDSDEHLMFLSIEDWVAVTEMAGFDISSVSIGQSYPVSGWDLCILARANFSKSANWHELRGFARKRSKIGKVFFGGTDPDVTYHGETSDTSRHRVLIKSDSVAMISAGRAETLLFHQDQWCGVVEIATPAGTRIFDSYSLFPTIGSFDVSDLDGPIAVRSAGKGRGKSTNVVLHGFLSSA